MNKTRSHEFNSAIRSLLSVACDTHADARVVARFLLAWWDGERLGGIQISHLWRLDARIQSAILTVFADVLREPVWPDQLGYADQFKHLEALWGRGVYA